MNTFTITELQDQIVQIEAEKQTVVDLVRNTRFMRASSKHFFCSQTAAEYNERANSVRALIHELEGQDEQG